MTRGRRNSAGCRACLRPTSISGLDDDRDSQENDEWDTDRFEVRATVPARIAQWRQAVDGEAPESRGNVLAALQAARSRSSDATFSNSRRVVSWRK